MLKNGGGVKIAIRVVQLILLILFAIGMCMGLKWFAGYLEIKEINEIWPEAEEVTHFCLIIFFAVAAIIFFIRMTILDFEKQMLKSKVYDTQSDKAVPVVKEEKPKENSVPGKTDAEIAAMQKELAKLKQWKGKACLLYPNLERDVDNIVMDFSF
jgi:hypothetical protein